MKQALLKRHGMLLMLAVFGLLTISSTASAQYGGYYGRDDRYGYDNRSIQIAINNGYQLGYGQGSNDRAYGQRYDVDRSKTFRDADSGYNNSGFRNKDEYKRLFRQGFETGYRDGYSGARRRGSYNNPGYSNQYPDWRRDRDYRDYGRRNGRDRRNGYDPYYDPRYRY